MIAYDPDATKATVWDTDTPKATIKLPLIDGWYRSDGNPFGVPNGEPSTYKDPDAFYLLRHRHRSFSGPVGFAVFGTERCFSAYGDWSTYLGVVLTEGHKATVAKEHDLVIPAELVRELKLLGPKSHAEITDLQLILDLLNLDVSLESTNKLIEILKKTLNV